MNPYAVWYVQPRPLGSVNIVWLNCVENAFVLIIRWVVTNIKYTKNQDYLKRSLDNLNVLEAFCVLGRVYLKVHNVYHQNDIQALDLITGHIINFDKNKLVKNVCVDIMVDEEGENISFPDIPF